MDSLVLARRKKKNNALSHVLRSGVSYRRSGLQLWCNSGSPKVTVFFLSAHPPLEQYITRTMTTHWPTVPTHTPHCMQTRHGMSRWYWTVHIPWLVAGLLFLSRYLRGTILETVFDGCDWKMLIAWPMFFYWPMLLASASSSAVFPFSFFSMGRYCWGLIQLVLLALFLCCVAELFLIITKMSLKFNWDNSSTLIVLKAFSPSVILKYFHDILQ